jgi:hypothetical protein
MLAVVCEKVPLVPVKLGGFLSASSRVVEKQQQRVVAVALGGLTRLDVVH